LLYSFNINYIQKKRRKRRHKEKGIRRTKRNLQQAATAGEEWEGCRGIRDSTVATFSPGFAFKQEATSCVPASTALTVAWPEDGTERKRVRDRDRKRGRGRYIYTA